MIFTADRRKRRHWAGLPAAVILALTSFAGHAEPEPRANLVERARQALQAGDGIDAEMKLRKALARGVPKEQLAAYFGSAFLQQNELVRAREWLGAGAFSSQTAAEGFRNLALLELAENKLDAAALAYDRALAMTPNDAGLWVEIGRLRYRRGAHLDAIEAGERAVALDPRSVRALEFRGQLVRDSYGLLASLPWFERALMQAPDDWSVLSEYAATLGELGRAGEMLVVTRRILELNPGDAQAYYLQAVLAARAGRYELARGLLARTGGQLDNRLGPVMLQAVLELVAGNRKIAAELVERVLARRPDYTPAQELLVGALFHDGRYRYVTLRFQDEIARDAASPYVLTVVARSYEALGERAQAGVLLDRAALPERAVLRVARFGSPVGALMAQGRSREALALAERDRAAAPGSFASQSIAGDVQLASGDPVAAQERYVTAARIRMSESLLLRRFEAYAAANDLRGASQMVEAWLVQNPSSRLALRLQAGLAMRSGDPRRAAAILDYLRRSGGGWDVALLSNLALAQLGIDAPDAGEQAAQDAYELQRASPIAAQALGLSYAALQVRRANAAALLDKARQILGDNPLLAQARGRLKG